MKDIDNQEMPIIEEATMNYLDNAIKQLNGAHEDLAADNQAAAAEDYGRRCISHHHACDCREAAFKAQIDRLIMQSNSLVYRLSHKVNAHEPINSTEFINMTGDLHKEIDVAMELIK